jgi:hypothetical protein
LILGNQCLSNKNTSIEGKSSNAGKKEKEERIKRKYSPKEDNDKLSFLKNPIKRPCALVESDHKGGQDDTPAYSLATASRMANIAPTYEKDYDSDHKKHDAVGEENLPHFSDLNDSPFAPTTSNQSKSEPKDDIKVDFNNLDDEVEDQGQSQAFANSDNRSANNDNISQDGGEPLTFKPSPFMKAKTSDSTQVPMSFGYGMLEG